jgi:hypothetical protein
MVNVKTKIYHELGQMIWPILTMEGGLFILFCQLEEEMSFFPSTYLLLPHDLFDLLFFLFLFGLNLKCESKKWRKGKVDPLPSSSIWVHLSPNELKTNKFIFNFKWLWGQITWDQMGQTFREKGKCGGLVNFM